MQIFKLVIPFVLTLSSVDCAQRGNSPIGFSGLYNSSTLRIGQQSAQQQVNILQAENSRLLTEISKLALENEKQKHDNSRLLAENEKLKRDNGLLATRLKQIESSDDSSRQYIEQRYTDTIKYLQTEKEELKAMVAQRQRKINELEATLMNLVDKISEMFDIPKENPDEDSSVFNFDVVQIARDLIKELEKAKNKLVAEIAELRRMLHERDDTILEFMRQKPTSSSSEPASETSDQDTSNMPVSTKSSVIRTRPRSNSLP